MDFGLIEWGLSECLAFGLVVDEIVSSLRGVVGKDHIRLVDLLELAGVALGCSTWMIQLRKLHEGIFDFLW